MVPSSSSTSTPARRMYRILMLAALLLGGFAVAQTITVATHYNAEQIAPVEQCAMQYEQEHGVDIVFQQISYGDYLQTVLTSRIGGQAPDIYHVYNIWAPQMVDNGVLAAPPDDLVQWIRDSYIDATVDVVTIAGQVWGIPTEVSNYLLVYNKQLLQDAGFDNPPSTWDELVEMAAQITQTNDQGQITTAGYAFGPSVANVVHPFFALLYSSGVSPFTEDFAGTNLASEEAIAILESQIRLFEEDITNSEVEVWDFPSGTIAMMIMAPWYEATLREAFADSFEDTVGVAPIPGGDDWRSLQYAFFLTVDSQSPNQEEAWSFLQWLNTARGDNPSCVGEMMFDLGALTANEADLERGGEALTDSYTAPFVAALERSNPEPSVLQAAEIERILQGYIQQAWAGELTAEEALTRADREITELLAEFY